MYSLCAILFAFISVANCASHALVPFSSLSSSFCLPVPIGSNCVYRRPNHSKRLEIVCKSAVKKRRRTIDDFGDDASLQQELHQRHFTLQAVKWINLATLFISSVNERVSDPLLQFEWNGLDIWAHPSDKGLVVIVGNQRSWGLDDSLDTSDIELNKVTSTQDLLMDNQDAMKQLSYMRIRALASFLKNLSNQVDKNTPITIMTTSETNAHIATAGMIASVIGQSRRMENLINDDYIRIIVPQFQSNRVSVDYYVHNYGDIMANHHVSTIITALGKKLVHGASSIIDKIFQNGSPFQFGILAFLFLSIFMGGIPVGDRAYIGLSFALVSHAYQFGRSLDEIGCEN